LGIRHHPVGNGIQGAILMDTEYSALKAKVIAPIVGYIALFMVKFAHLWL
jgi:hypothetical protein